jgi:hypothetical protein
MYLTLKDEMGQFNCQAKEHMSAFDGDAILQIEPNDLEENPIATDGEGLTAEEDLEDDPDGRGFDPMIRAEIIVPHRECNMVAIVQGCKRDANGNSVERKHKNPVLCSRLCLHRRCWR